MRGSAVVAHLRVAQLQVFEALRFLFSRKADRLSASSQTVLSALFSLSRTPTKKKTTKEKKELDEEKVNR
jgi:hypothetical protein